MDDYLPKPLRFDDLRAVLEKYAALVPVVEPPHSMAGTETGVCNE